MNYFLLLFGFFCNAVAVTDAYNVQPAVNHAEIDLINQHNPTWTAGVNTFMVDKSIEDIKKLCGTHLDDFSIPLNTTRVYDVKSDVPVSFDAREQWPNYIHPIRNQEKCGSCWAFSAAEVLSDRFSIATNGLIQTVLSPEDLVSCDKTNMGCGGGQLSSAWEYIENTGIVSDACFPYTSGNGTAPKCTGTCADHESFNVSKHKVTKYYQLQTIEDIQRDILQHGPVQTGFRVYKSFMAYKSGIYQRHWWNFLDSILGGHAVKIVGWGTDLVNGKSTDYWLVANSWDTTWGEDGYFKIKRGVNMCGIEGDVYAGIPELSTFKNSIKFY